jgi:hypothetical protein
MRQDEPGPTACLGLAVFHKATMMLVMLDIEASQAYFSAQSTTEVSMLARERFAWIWLIALVVVLGSYLLAAEAFAPQLEAMGQAQRIGLLAVPLGLLGVIALATHGVAWLRRNAREPGEPDERDRAIEHRASHTAYYVLMAGMILVGCVMPFSDSGWRIVHAALFFIAVAEVVHSGLIVSGYRRGLRG